MSTPVLGVHGIRLAQGTSEEGVRLLPQAPEGEWRRRGRKHTDDHRSHTLEKGDSLNEESGSMSEGEERRWLHDDIPEYRTFSLQRKGIDEKVERIPSFVAVHGKSRNGKSGQASRFAIQESL